VPKPGHNDELAHGKDEEEAGMAQTCPEQVLPRVEPGTQPEPKKQAHERRTQPGHRIQHKKVGKWAEQASLHSPVRHQRWWQAEEQANGEHEAGTGNQADTEDGGEETGSPAQCQKCEQRKEQKLGLQGQQLAGIQALLDEAWLGGEESFLRCRSGQASFAPKILVDKFWTANLP
jgi:hypothetical protein